MQILLSKEKFLRQENCQKIHLMSKEKANKTMEEIVHLCIQKTESDILRMNDWNLDLATGSDILSMLLKLSNDEYDFN